MTELGKPQTPFGETFSGETLFLRAAREIEGARLLQKLTETEMRILDAVDFFGTAPDTIRADLRATHGDLVRRGFITTETRYVLTDKARKVVEARDQQKAPR